MIKNMMYRLSKTVLITLVASVAFLLFSSVLKEYDTETIPNAQTCIQVNSDEHKNTKSKIFATFSKLARKGNYQFTLVQLVNINNKSIKSVHSFNSNGIQLFSYYKESAVNIIGNNNMQLEDDRGKYYTTAKGNELLKLKAKLTKLGLNYDTYKVSLFKHLEASAFSNGYLPIIISIFSILLIIMFIEKIFQFKKYAILQLNGLTIKQIILRDIKSNYLVYLGAITLALLAYLIYLLFILNLMCFISIAKYVVCIYLFIIFIYLILDLLSYSSLFLINIYPAIQGKSYSKPFVITGYLLKICLVLIVAINTRSLHNEINIFVKDQNIMKMWINHHSGYTLQFKNISNIGHQEENVLGEKTRHLLNISHNTIMSKNSQEFHPDIYDTTPEDGNILIINKNYLKYNNIVLSNNSIANKDYLRPNYINVLIPRDRVKQKRKFSKNLKLFLSFQRELPGSNKEKFKKLKINWIEYKKNQYIFNYTIGKDIRDSISKDPIIILDNNLFSDNFYLATATQGMIQFNNFEELKKNINKLFLKNYIAGITDAKTRLSDFNIKLSRQIVLIGIITLISVSQLLLVIIFISITFLQKHRLKMAIIKIFGQSNGKIILKFWLFNVVGDALLIILLIVLRHESLQIFWYLVPYLIVESIVIFILADIAQKRLLVTLNHGN